MDDTTAEPFSKYTPRGWRWSMVLLALFLLAFAARFFFLLRSGLNSFGAYDDGVHYAAAANLLAGNLPYKDFLFLHPPGIILLGTPFAALAHAVGDPAAFTMFRILLQLIAAASAVMIAVILKRWGWAAAITGGVLYALSFPAVYGGRSALLEPTGELGILLALAAIMKGADSGRKGWFLLAGLAAGMACDFKVWYIGGAIALLIFLPGIVNRVRYILSAFVAICVIYLPFFLQAPQKMFQMLVLDQLGRGHNSSATFGVRMRSVLGVSGSGGDSIYPHIPSKPVVVALLVVLMFLCLLLVTERRFWIILGLLGVNLGIVLLAPSYFQHYAILPAADLALVGGAAVGFLPGELSEKRGRQRAMATVFATIGILGAVVVNARHDLNKSGEQLDPKMIAAIQQAGCVKSDDPTVLVLSNVVTKNLAEGCEVRPDLSGMSYDWAKKNASGHLASRANNPIFQQAAVNYLLDSDAEIRVRSGAFSYTKKSRAQLDRGPLLLDAGGRKLYASAPASE